MPEFLFTYTDLDVDPVTVTADSVDVHDGQFMAHRGDDVVVLIPMAGVRSVVRRDTPSVEHKVRADQLEELLAVAHETANLSEAARALAVEELALAQQARRTKEHQLDDIRRALCDVGMMQDGDPYSHADLADVIRQTPSGPSPMFAKLLRQHRESMARADAAVAEACARPSTEEAPHE